MELVHDFAENIAGIAITSDDTILVANTDNSSIDWISFIEGKVSLTKGPKVQEFDYLYTLSFDKNEVLHIGSNGKIFNMTLEGKVTKFVGSETGYGDGTGDEVKLTYPHGICFDDSGFIYFCDGLNHCIRKVSPEGKVTTLCGNGNKGDSDGNGQEAQFSHPYGIVFDKSLKIFYVTDRDNKKIRTVTLDGTVGTLCEYSTLVRSIAIDGNGNLFVSMGNYFNKTVKPGIITINPQGEIKLLENTDVHGIHDSFGMAFNSKGDLFVTTYSGKLYVIRNCTKFPPLQNNIVV